MLTKLTFFQPLPENIFQEIFPRVGITASVLAALSGCHLTENPGSASRSVGRLVNVEEIAVGRPSPKEP